MTENLKLTISDSLYSWIHVYEIWLCTNKAKHVACTVDHKVALRYQRWTTFNQNWWHHEKANLAKTRCTYFSRNSCRPWRRWSTWWGLFILKKGVLDGSSGNCLYKEQASTQLKTKLKQWRKLIQANANPTFLKIMSHIPEASLNWIWQCKVEKSEGFWQYLIRNDSDSSGPVDRTAGMPA